MQQTQDIEQKKERAASSLQRLWRSYTNRKIYKYYRDIIMFKCKYRLIYEEEILQNY
jgi:hypothetical protein